ncbi:hypothetical protein MHT86_04860 [Corynebacterium mastitidis]|uniref:hypothetical protein n=1 Tax=Corynebacterium mastitidis TaxID=161890 RepID=UPI0012FEDA08|nr:hypothetical protein [Corynebacterium mastitidis]MCH6196831.1 hypothetical protein [Corynebacterium mastitidis]
MAGKRAQKKLARQQNNAGVKSLNTAYPREKNKTRISSSALRGTESYKDKTVRWTAREIDPTPAEFGCRWSLNDKETVELLRFLDDVSGKTWRECEAETSDGHKRNHYHDVTGLPGAVRHRLQSLDEAEEQVFRFRLSGRRRLWGFRSDDLFRILWYDPEHSVYPLDKRHT